MVYLFMNLAAIPLMSQAVLVFVISLRDEVIFRHILVESAVLFLGGPLGDLFALVLIEHTDYLLTCREITNSFKCVLDPLI